MHNEANITFGSLDIRQCAFFWFDFSFEQFHNFKKRCHHHAMDGIEMNDQNELHNETNWAHTNQNLVFRSRCRHNKPAQNVSKRFFFCTYAPFNIGPNFH